MVYGYLCMYALLRMSAMQGADVRIARRFGFSKRWMSGKLALI